ncbi:MAG TPA: PAS domain-containing protein [Parvibaculum sp.]
MDLAQADRRPATASRAHPVDFNHPGFTAFYDYWQSVRPGAGIPTSSAFDLLEIAGWLSDVTVLDVASLNVATVRFVGTGLVERLGIDPTGMNVLSMQAKNSFDRAARGYHAMANLPCGGMARYVSVYSSGREAIARSLYLPVATPTGEPPRLVSMSAREEGGGVYADPIERTVTGTKILSLDWFDLGFGVPADF